MFLIILLLAVPRRVFSFGSSMVFRCGVWLFIVHLIDIKIEIDHEILMHDGEAGVH